MAAGIGSRCLRLLPQLSQGMKASAGGATQNTGRSRTITAAATTISTRCCAAL
jgi:hypothetical protein